MIDEVDESEVPCHGSYVTDARAPGRHFASSVVKIPRAFLMFLGLLLSPIPRILWATPDTSGICDPSHLANTYFAGATARSVCFIG